MAKAKYTRRKDGRFATTVWDGTYTAPGKKRRVPIYSTISSRDLERKVAEYNQRREAGDLTLTPPDKVRLLQYARHWLDVYKTPKALNTYKMYERIINTHLSTLGEDFRLTAFTHSVLQLLISERLDRPRTCQQIVITCKQIVRAAERDRLLPRGTGADIFADLALPKYAPSEKRALTPQEKDVLFAADLSPQEKAFVSVIYYTGSRRGEALALTLFDLSFKDRTIRISKALAFDENDPYQKDTKNRRGSRIVPMPAPLYALLRDYVRTIKGPELFTTRDGRPMTKSAYRRMWDSIRAKLKAAYLQSLNASDDDYREAVNWDVVGFDSLTAHVFRHNYCTSLCYQMVEGKNISFKKIAELLGDTEKMVMEVYSHVLSEREDAAGAVEEALEV